MKIIPRQGEQKIYRARSGPSFSGFSLVEVVIAVGIMALGITAILGLLPHGLAMTKKTADLTYQTRIFQQILSEYQAKPWSQITGGIAGGAEPLRYFDYEGIELRNGQEALLSFVAQIELPSSPVTLPSTATPAPNDNLRRLLVRIAATPDRNFDFERAGRKTCATYSALLAKTN